MPYSFIIDSILVQAQRKKENILVEYDESFPDKSTCVVYFSSNGIYYPNDEDTFHREIVEKDRYDWYKTRKAAYKHIFVRDVYKQWYLGGVNEDVNSIEKLVSRLIELTSGMQHVTTIGSSAGGYASILFGHYLNAEFIFAFSPQVDLNREFSRGLLPLWERYTGNYLHYINIAWALSSRVCFFYPVDSECDQYQFSKVKDWNGTHLFKINTDQHGALFTGMGLINLFKLSWNQIIDIPSHWYYCPRELSWLFRQHRLLLKIAKVIPYFKFYSFCKAVAQIGKHK